jgi:putative DNA primase/helicase
MSDVFSEATGRWKEIFQILGMPENTWKENKPCVFCVSRDSASLLDGNNSSSVYFCRHCRSHSPLAVIEKVKGVSSKEAFVMVREALGQSPAKVEPKKIDPSKVNRLRKGAIANHPEIGNYLRNRHIYTVPEQNVYYQPKAFGYADKDCTKTHAGPAMISAIMDSQYKLMGYHKTFIEGGYKAKIDEPKQITVMRSIKGGFVPLFAAKDVVGIAEGIETALKCRGLFDIPVWSAINAGGMENIQLPSSIKEVYVFGDNDANFVGQYAAVSLAKRLHLAGYKVHLKISEKKDFAEV